MRSLSDAGMTATGEGVVRLAAPRPSNACGSALRVAAVTLLGYGVMELPLAGNPMQGSGIWTSCGVLICVATELLGAAGAIGRCVRSDMLPCAAAIGVGITLDFLRVPPQAVLDLCSTRGASGYGWIDVIRDHCRWFPVTMLAMVIAIVLPRLRGPLLKRTGYAGRVIAGLSGVAFDLVIMAIAMAACMSAMRKLAAVERLPWVAGGVICAMLVGMLAFTLARALLRRIATYFTQRVWRHLVGAAPKRMMHMSTHA
ncbi:MAG: hypothetical protein ABIW82_09685 [Dokdonella sp.]